MSNATPLTDQSGRPVGMVITPKGAHIEVLGKALPPSQRGASIHVAPKGGGRPNGDFPVKHPNSGDVAKKKPPTPKTITPIDNGTLGRVYTMRLPAPGTNNQTPPPDPDERPWHERGWDEIERAGAKAFESWKKAAQTAWDALPGTADAATTAAARQSIGQGAMGTLEGLGTLLGPSAEFTQAAYISGNAEAIALVEQMQQSQRAAFGAMGDSVKSAWNEAYARNGAVGASAMVLATLGMEAAGGKGLGALGKAAGTVADIVRVAKTPMEAATRLDEAIAAAKAAGASADEIALLERARAERLAQARREAAQGKDGVVIVGRVSTKPNTAFFWSGRTKDANGKVRGGSEDAARMAKEHDGTTLETLIEERGIKMPDWDPTDPSSIKAWEDISAEYARGASGEVRAVIGQDLRPGNIWEAKEFPALKANPNVTKITTIDPLTGASKVVYP